MEIRVPEEIVGQIFSKLPAKSLLRFKCLSKSLNSLISSPNFIRSHVPRSQGDLPKFVCGSYFFDVNTAVEAKPVNVSGADFDSNYYSIIVWNPLIREYRILPMPASGDYVSYGLGYDSVTDDYKVVQCGYSKNHLIKQNALIVLSLKSNSMRKHENLKFNISYGQAGTFLHGALHWVAELANSGWVADFANSGKIIVAFNLADEKIVQLKLPKDNNGVRGNKYELSVIKGCLCYYTISRNSTFCLNIWAMKEYGTTSSWTKLITIPQKRMHKVLGHFCFTGNAVFMVSKLCGGNAKLIRYDLKNKKLKTFETFERVLPIMVSFMESLVSPISN
ncbi:F-box protein CPR1 [Jatropha curcas]|uniref:F-box protein CPR1 n=1 Tax=Jatropha curcas TaxID=180498 RepID=UPI0018946F05|nr:F-box protein CPR1 [Jatropha curcas]